jgi:hypothetical protein
MGRGLITTRSPSGPGNTLSVVRDMLTTETLVVITTAEGTNMALQCLLPVADKSIKSESGPHRG